MQILLSRHLDPVFAAGAFIIPTSVYFVLKVSTDILTLALEYVILLFLGKGRREQESTYVILLYLMQTQPRFLTGRISSLFFTCAGVVELLLDC